VKHFTKDQILDIVSPKDLEGLNREEIYNLSLQWFAAMSDYCTERAGEAMKFYNRLDEGIKGKKFRDEGDLLFKRSLLEVLEYDIIHICMNNMLTYGKSIKITETFREEHGGFLSREKFNANS